jgi:hypothetical protein
VSSAPRWVMRATQVDVLQKEYPQALPVGAAAIVFA